MYKQSDKEQQLLFKIADEYVRIEFKHYRYSGLDLLPSFAPFLVKKAEKEPNLTILIDDCIKPFPKNKRELIKKCDTGNGDILIYLTKEGKNQYIIKNINGESCCLLKANKYFNKCECALNGNYNMRVFGINNAVMLAFTHSMISKNIILLHASVLRYNGKGYPFIAKSGTGKSTHVSMWLQSIEDCDLINDDNPAIRIIDNQAFIYGTPWSGKTPCYRNIKVPLGAISQIVRAEENSVEKLSPTQAFACIINSSGNMRWK